MSARRRRAKAARNTVAYVPRPPHSLLSSDSDWITSGRIGCSYGAHLREELPDYPLGPAWTCPRCGAVYLEVTP